MIALAHVNDEENPVRTMDDAGDPTKDGQKDVDELLNRTRTSGTRLGCARRTYEVCIATPFEEHTERWQEDGKAKSAARLVVLKMNGDGTRALTRSKRRNEITSNSMRGIGYTPCRYQKR